MIIIKYDFLLEYTVEIVYDKVQTIRFHIYLIFITNNIVMNTIKI